MRVPSTFPAALVPKVIVTNLRFCSHKMADFYIGAWNHQLSKLMSIPYFMCVCVVRTNRLKY